MFALGYAALDMVHERSERSIEDVMETKSMCAMNQKYDFTDKKMAIAKNEDLVKTFLEESLK